MGALQAHIGVYGPVWAIFPYFFDLFANHDLVLVCQAAWLAGWLADWLAGWLTCWPGCLAHQGQPGLAAWLLPLQPG